MRAASGGSLSIYLLLDIGQSFNVMATPQQTGVIRRAAIPPRVSNFGRLGIGAASEVKRRKRDRRKIKRRKWRRGGKSRGRGHRGRGALVYGGSIGRKAAVRA